jgi:hypothetical protein
MRGVPPVLIVITCVLGACTFDPQTPEMGDDDGGVTDVDRDGDGIGATDNCPELANPDQRDHDGDGKGDVCDACPHLTGGDDDPDGDGIGVACDPEPSVKNPPPYWNGLYDPPDLMWSVPNGMGGLADWQVQDRAGKRGWAQTVLDGSQRHHLVLAGVREESFVMSAFVVDQIADGDGTSYLRSATVSFGYTKSPTSGDEFYFNCGVRSDTYLDQSTVIASAFLNDTIRDDQTMPWPNDVTGKTLVVEGRADRINGSGPKMGDSALACDADNSTTQQLVQNESTDYPDGQVGLRTYGMTAWFDYLFVVEPIPF